MNQHWDLMLGVGFGTSSQGTDMHNTLSGTLPQDTTDMAQAIQRIEKLAALTFLTFVASAAL